MKSCGVKGSELTHQSQSSRIILNEKWLFPGFLSNHLQAETYLFRSTGPML